MVEWSCCDNPTITDVREEPFPDGGKRKYYKCLNCQTDHVLTFGNDGGLLDHQTSRQRDFRPVRGFATATRWRRGLLLAPLNLLILEISELKRKDSPAAQKRPGSADKEGRRSRQSGRPARMRRRDGRDIPRPNSRAETILPSFRLGTCRRARTGQREATARNRKTYVCERPIRPASVGTEHAPRYD